MPADLSVGAGLPPPGRPRPGHAALRGRASENPDRDDALHLLGLVRSDGDPARASRLIERAVALRPDVADYRSCLAEAYRLLGQTDRAVQAHLEAHRLNPASPEILCNLGALLIDLGQLDDAVAASRQAIRLNPNFAGGHNNLANALRLQGEASAAASSIIGPR